MLSMTKGIDGPQSLDYPLVGWLVLPFVLSEPCPIFFLGGMPGGCLPNPEWMNRLNRNENSLTLL